MFEYFPGNYVWNLGVVADAEQRRPDRRGRPGLPADPGGRRAGRGRRHAGLPARLDGADRPARRPGRGRREGRAHPHRRPAVLPGHQLPVPGRADAVALRPEPDARPTSACLELAQKVVRPARARGSRRVEIPYEGTDAAGLLQPGAGHRRRPGAGHDHVVNGLDSTKEHMYTSEHWAELAARGISCLMVDQPGTGEALRLQGLTARDRHRGLGRRRASTTCETRDDVDAARIGLVGWSLGGYYAPRAAAFEKRLALVRRLGRQPQLGRGAAPPARARGRAPGPALLGARAVGVGLRRRRRRSSSSPTTCTSTASSSRSPCRS